MRVRTPTTARQVGQDGRCVHRLSEPSGGAVDVREPGEPVETTHVEVTDEKPPVTVEVV